MNRLIVTLFILFDVLVSLCAQTSFVFPNRKADAPTGSQFIAATTGMSAFERDSIVYKEICNGNMPQWLKSPIEIKDTLYDAKNQVHDIVFYVLPDFIAIGSDDDFFRVPLLPTTAQKIADYFGASLPTRKISNLIHRFSEIKLTPHPMTPDETMTTLPVFVRHDSIIESQRKEFDKPLGSLIAGHKKDIVISSLLASNHGQLFIYGWHYPDGKAIQQLFYRHWDKYVDYSHGARLVLDDVIIDGNKHSLKQVLSDPNLYTIFSDEDQPIIQLGYIY
ncbi:MAG: hypothetical protein K2I94_00510 [Muribaculaceae bacterium]|nr:hypothetical protein [Muribaculaceae bacterium]